MTEPAASMPPADTPGALARWIVGVGASAGGQAPLAAFLGACPRGAGLACVVVQHLGADHVGSPVAMLQPHTALTVQEASDGLRPRADHVYVLRPGTEVRLEGGRLRVAPPQGGDRSHPIDVLLHSLALELGPAAAGVILSGLGSDGAQGLRSIAAVGGRALVQQPDTAAFDAMPRNAAAAAGPASGLAPPEALARLLLQPLAPEGTPTAHDAPPAEGEPTDELAAIVAHLATVTGHDFGAYKSSSVQRRIERRLAVHGLTSLSAYRRLLTESAQEAALLQKELFIGVTAFFRDPAVWQAAAEAALPALLQRAAQRPQRRLRGWVVGCSTGEEAYTLAMLLVEQMERDALSREVEVQIFATDANADAVEFARRGLYPDSALAPLTPQRRARFFVAEGGGWRVSKSLREKVLFARHDLIRDAPFSRLDLVSCRNLLIYLRASMQEKVLRLFHYVLQPEGRLVLGHSETVGRAEGLFEPLDPKSRIYRRIDVPGTRASPSFPIPADARPALRTPESPAVSERETPVGPSLQTLAERLILDEVSPPAVIVDATGDILYVSGRTGSFLEPAAGRANWNVHAMAREGLRVALSAGMRQALDEGKPVLRRGLKVEFHGAEMEVELTVRPLQWAGHGPLQLIIFRELPPAPKRRRHRAARDEELQRAVEEAQALREEMRSSQEELQSTNEELQSTNEELQSTNEELTTSKEEMQAMNEELQTVNSELMSKIEDLAQAQSDLRNLLNSTQIATLFLDAAMNVRRFTEQAKKVINLREGDVGRPLTDLTTTLEYPELIEDVTQVLRTLEFNERSIRTLDGRWYSVRVMPYRTAENVIDGSVLTFVDITPVKTLEAQLYGAAQAARGSPADPPGPDSPDSPASPAGT